MLLKNEFLFVQDDENNLYLRGRGIIYYFNDFSFIFAGYHSKTLTLYFRGTHGILGFNKGDESWPGGEDDEMAWLLLELFSWVKQKILCKIDFEIRYSFALEFEKHCTV